MKHDEVDKERKEKHKQWMRSKNEEMRRSLQRVYGPTPVFDSGNLNLMNMQHLKFAIEYLRGLTEVKL